jgi:hypothetical protein
MALSIPGGLGSSISIATESTYGTFATPTRSFEFLDETMDYSKVIAQGAGIKQGALFEFANRRAVGTSDGGGDLHLEIPTKGLGLLLSMFMGASTLTQQAATAAWLQVHTPADLLGKFFTVQKGVAQADGTVVPYSFVGCKGSKFELGASAGQLLTGKFTIDAQDVQIAPAYAAPTYLPTANVLSFAGGSIVVGGTPTYSTTALATGGTALAGITDFSLVVDRQLEAGEYYFNNSGKKAEPKTGRIKGTVAIKADFIDTTFANAHLTDGGLAIVLNFVGQTIATTYKETLQIVIPMVKFNGELPKVNGPKIVNLSINGNILDDRTNVPLYIGYQSSDTAL